MAARILGVIAIETVGDHQLEDGVAEELEPLVVVFCRVVGTDRAMSD